MLGLKSLDEFANEVVIAGGEENQAAAGGAKNKTKVEARSTLEIIPTQTPDTETGMEMWLTESIADGVDRSCYVAAPLLRKSSNVAPKGFRKINLQDRPRGCRYIA